MSILVLSLALAQCPDFGRGFATSGVGGFVETLASHDDGSGPSVFAGGTFPTAGDAIVNHVARWDGTAWHDLAGGVGGGPDPRVLALLSADLGSGPRLFAGGSFDSAGGAAVSNVTAWDGTAWSALGTPLVGTVTALAAFDDGSGPQLHAAGNSGQVVRWNGTSWTALGGVFGPNGGGGVNAVNALAVFDDGSGPKLYAGGRFTSYAGNPVSRVARWNGAAWTAVGAGLAPGEVFRLRTLDDGGGARLYACGSFTSAVARWDGAAWNALPGIQAGSTALDIAFGDDGAGGAPRLISTGNFGGLTYLARWLGATWGPVGEGLSGEGHALAHLDTGAGPALLVGGWQTGTPSTTSPGIVQRRAGTFLPVYSGGGSDASVSALASFDAGNGPELYVGGTFTGIGGLRTWGLARTDGFSYSALPPGGLTSNVRALIVHDDGSGPALYVAQYFDLSRWNGVSWSVPGTSSSGIETFAEHDDGSGLRLYAGGSLSGRVQRWNGTAWSIVGGTLPHNVASLATADFGAGPRLFAGSYGGGPGSGLHQWDGATWTLVAGGVQGYAKALAVFDDGSGLALYVGGGFVTVGGSVPATYIARWNGASWSAVGGGMNAAVQAFRVFDDGSGPKLYATGGFTSAGGQSARGLARWDGVSWTGLGGAGLSFSSTLVGSGQALEPFDDGSGVALYVGGSFRSAGTRSAANLAKWSCAADQGSRFCAGDGLDPAVSASCPCANSGGPGRGCANSASAIGAELVAISGSLAGDDLVLGCSGMPPTSTALFVRGSTPIAGAVVFGDGLRCVGGSLVRLATKTAVAGVVAFPEIGDPSLSVRGGTPVGSGVQAWYQIYYRNVASYCTSAAFNLSNGWRARW